jgi:hypothetical protein
MATMSSVHGQVGEGHADIHHGMQLAPPALVQSHSSWLAHLHLVGDRLEVLQVGPQHVGAVMAAHAMHEAFGADVGPHEACAEEGVLHGLGGSLHCSVKC